MSKERDSQISVEDKDNMQPTYNFVILKPGGNDTGLFEGVIHDIAKRKLIADALLKEYPNVEQVGFVNLDPNNAELMMTGGEFCGNATRSTAFAALKGEPGEIMIKVSGVKNKLKAGVTSNGEAFSQMPIYPEISKINPDSEVPGNFTVEMEGITHYVDFNPNPIKGLTEADIKTRSRTEMKRRGIDKGPACGIIYAEKKGVNWEIYPVVYVRDADTLYYETACGSGTTALGLTLALKEGKSINEVPIFQPSGMAIKFSVEFNGKEFGYAQIQGKVEELAEGKQILEKDGAYAVEQITDYPKLEKALKEQGLTKLYKDIFSKAPYFEDFSDKNVETFFKEYVDGGKLFLAYDAGKVVGFGASQPIKDAPDVEKTIKEAGVDATDVWYMADLGVNEEYRGKGIAKTLVQSRIDAAPVGSRILMRTSINNIASQTLYRNLGFKDVPDTFQYVDSIKLGVQVADKRLFLIRNRDNS